jgi:hypothetical protein
MRLALVALAACTPATPPAITGITTAHAIPDTPPPTIKWIDNGFYMPALPAVSTDGSTILVPDDQLTADDLPTLTFVLVDRGDHIMERHPVMVGADARVLFDKHGQTPALRDRIAAANRWLADQHRAHHFVPLTALIYTDVPGHWVGSGFTLDWSPAELHIAIERRTLVRGPTPDSWLDNDPLCPAGLNTAHADAAHGVAVLSFAYVGTSCTQRPPDQIHVVAW